ncbi:uncharacterized protein DUF1702 [Nonomuraea polychroma]|uniref:Uncharacterized protein DUF1702 n=1 Tax=Nonomuraea polychroma TaxID=46176 RepID=A0A438M1S2_9ACTN|nr:DUF1702 family protein [Nonomuraea polychroma]RVX39776.1 uncharacterized protein DUF1702 [Nonomuraea polychroma]
MIRRMLAIGPRKLALEGRCHPAEAPETQRALEEVVKAFAVGYNTALAGPTGELTFPDLPRELRGFAFEGAAMSTALVDQLTMGGGRGLRELAAGAGERYIHLIHVGAGWAYARLRRRPWAGTEFAHPLLGWLAWDGWGFHQAFFHPQAVFVRQAVERRGRGSVQPIRDQGAGRALWFYAGANVARIAGIIGGFPAGRRRDLWAGIGLAAAYTGARQGPAVDELLTAADGYRDHLAQGAAFAAKARVLSGVMPSGCAAAVEAITGVDAETAADWTDGALSHAIRFPDSPDAYEMWRAGIRDAWNLRAHGVAS